MSDRYFDGIQVGDKVYLLNDDEPYIVTRMYDDSFKAESHTGIIHNVLMDGEVMSSADDLGQLFFWQPVHIDPPPRPKRKVKKVVGGWVNIFTHAVVSDSFVVVSRLHKTKEQAESNRAGMIDLIFLGDPLYIRHEYEVEE